MIDYPADAINYYMKYFSEWMGAPSNLLKTLAEKESSYNPITGDYRVGCNALNACGILALRPPAIEEARRMGYNIDPHNSIQSIVGAVILFYKNDQYMRRYVKNPDWATRVIAYNGGWTAGVKFAQTGIPPSREGANYLSYVASRTGIA